MRSSMITFSSIMWVAALCCVLPACDGGTAGEPGDVLTPRSQFIQGGCSNRCDDFEQLGIDLCVDDLDACPSKDDCQSGKAVTELCAACADGSFEKCYRRVGLEGRVCFAPRPPCDDGSCRPFGVACDG